MYSIPLPGAVHGLHGVTVAPEVEAAITPTAVVILMVGIPSISLVVRKMVLVVGVVFLIIILARVAYVQTMAMPLLGRLLQRWYDMTWSYPLLKVSSIDDSRSLAATCI